MKRVAKVILLSIISACAVWACLFGVLTLFVYLGDYPPLSYYLELFYGPVDIIFNLVPFGVIIGIISYFIFKNFIHGVLEWLPFIVLASVIHYGILEVLDIIVMRRGDHAGEWTALIAGFYAVASCTIVLALCVIIGGVISKAKGDKQ